MGDWTEGQLAALTSEAEVDIETTRKHGESRRTTIWVVVDGSDVFIRSVRGSTGRWYRDVSVRPEAGLWVDGERIPVQAVRASDAESVGRCSDAFARKYAGDLSTPSMIRPETLGTTLRLVPLEFAEPTGEGGGR